MRVVMVSSADATLGVEGLWLQEISRVQLESDRFRKKALMKARCLVHWAGCARRRRLIFDSKRAPIRELV